jgi:hypothetical protein
MMEKQAKRAKPRTQVKDPARREKKLTKDEIKHVRGGSGGSGTTVKQKPKENPVGELRDYEKES